MNRAISSKLTTRVFPALLLAILSTASLAESPGFLWNVETQLRYDDNVFRTPDNEESDGIFVVKPNLSWLSLYGKHRFDLKYEGDYSLYFDISDLNYFNNHLKAHALLDHTSRTSSEYTLGHRWGQDQPGETDALSDSLEDPDEWRDGYAEGKVYFGRRDSQGQIVGRLGYHQRRYTNNNQEFRDYNLLGATSTFFYRVAPKTRLLFEISFLDYDYQNSDNFGGNQTNQEYRYLTGVTWEATAKTTSIFKIGYRDRNYDDDRFSDLTGLTLWLDGIWEPNDYTKVTLGASQENQESARQLSGGYVSRYIRGGLEYGITPRTLLITKVRYDNDDFEDRLDREDDSWDLRLGMKYSLLRRLDLGAEYRFEDRDSTQDIFDFRSNIFMLTASTRFKN